MFVRLPNGFVSSCSDAVGRIWLRRPGYVEVREMPKFQRSTINIEAAAPKIYSGKNNLPGVAGLEMNLSEADE